MSRVALLFSVSAGLFLAACSDHTLTSEPPGPGQPNFAATTSTVNLRIPVSFITPAGLGGCLLEDIQFTGTAHVVLHFTESASGNILDRFTANDQNFAGVGLTTGTRYRRVGATQQTVQVNAALPMVVSFTDTFHFIGQGRAPNLLLQQTFHLTINANGEVTAEVDNFRLECK